MGPPTSTPPCPASTITRGSVLGLCGIVATGVFGAGCLGVICVVGLVILAINIAILIWVYKDAQARGADPMLWLILVFFTGLIGLIIWLVVRPPLRV